MNASSGGIPPSGGPKGPPSEPPKSNEPQTGFGKAYELQGDSGIKRYARKWFPGMTEKQLDQFQQRFLMTVIQSINKQINQELQEARKAAKKLKESEEGDN